MSHEESTVNTQEIEQFGQYTTEWWDKEGPLRTLHEINPARLEFIKEHVSLDGMRVLDVGCGGGILSEALGASGALVTGIDAAKEAIQVAKEHAKQTQLTIEYQCSTIEQYQSEPYDLIVCMELLEHVSHPQVVLNHCRRLLKAGGFLFLSTISRTVKAYATVVLAAEYLLNCIPRQTHDYRQFILPSELAQMARDAAFHLIDLKGLSYHPILRKAALTSDVSMNYLMVCK